MVCSLLRISFVCGDRGRTVLISHPQLMLNSWWYSLKMRGLLINMDPTLPEFVANMAFQDSGPPMILEMNRWVFVGECSPTRFWLGPQRLLVEMTKLAQLLECLPTLFRAGWN